MITGNPIIPLMEKSIEGKDNISSGKTWNTTLKT
jgi:hypothetical protein